MSTRILTCGVIMPISSMPGYDASHWAEVLAIITDAVKSISECQFTAKMVSDADAVGVIHRRIVQNIYSSDIVICDVSAKNANVMFELGMRLAFDKPTVIIKDDQTDYAFDTAVIEHLTYPKDLRFTKIQVFARKLAEKVLATYKTAHDNPSHSVFLKNFGDFRAVTLPSRPVIGEDEVERIAYRLHEILNHRGQSTNECVSGRPPLQTRYPVTEDSIAKGEFQIHYQPTMTSEGRVTGVEALVRRMNEKQELELPSAFLSQLEESGLIGPLQRWIVKTVANDFSEWQAQHIQIPRIAVNISLRNLSEADIRAFGNIASNVGMSLQAEVTESDLIIETSEGTSSKLFALKKAGIAVVIDDFGTGYSSLAQLRKAPVDYLKIDGSFIRDLLESDEATSIVTAIISLAHSIGCKTIAERVEKVKQVELLKKFDCDEFQGNLLAEPMPASRLYSFMAKRND